MLDRDVLRPDLVERALSRAIERLRPTTEGAADREAVTADLAAVEAELERLAAAVAAGGTVPALIRAVESRERRRLQLTRQLAAFDRQADRGDLDLRRLRRDLIKRLEDCRALFSRNVPQARQILRKLLQGPVLFTPQAERKGYRFSGRVSVGRLLGGMLETGSWRDYLLEMIGDTGKRQFMVASPTGFEPVFWP